MAAVPDLATRIRAVAQGDTELWTPPPVRAAATVALLRDGEAGVEVYLMRRTSTMAFAPEMHVFPGGAVEAEDGPDGSEESFRAAAIREVEEETGVRIGDLADLVPFARWVTPAVEKRRYDTAFFATAVPAEQLPALVGTEASHARWVTPARALAANAAGEMAMLPPTLATLGQLDGHDDVAATLFAVSRLPRPALMPVPRAEGEGVAWELIDYHSGATITDLEEAGLPPTWGMGLG